MGHETGGNPHMPTPIALNNLTPPYRIPPHAHPPTHRHKHTLTSVQNERYLSQAGTHDLSDTGSLVTKHPPTGQVVSTG